VGAIIKNVRDSGGAAGWQTLVHYRQKQNPGRCLCRSRSAQGLGNSMGQFKKKEEETRPKGTLFPELDSHWTKKTVRMPDKSPTEEAQRKNPGEDGKGKKKGYIWLVSKELAHKAWSKFGKNEADERQGRKRAHLKKKSWGREGSKGAVGGEGCQMREFRDIAETNNNSAKIVITESERS